MVTNDEKWLPIREFPDYEVSDTGGVRRATAARGTRAGKLRTPVLNSSGYTTFVFDRRTRPTLRMGHRLVADAFLGPIPHGMQVNHKNGIKHDNRVENLEIVTNSENRAHAYRVLGVKPNKPSVYGNATLDWVKVDKIRAEHAAGGTSYSKLAAKYGVCRHSIMRVCLKRGWRDENRPSSP